MQTRWGCPRAQHKPPPTLPPDLCDDAEDWARITGSKLPCTCPLAGRLRPAELDVIRVHRLVREHKGGITPAEILGRPLSAWDVCALDELVLARAEVDESDQKIREEEARRRRPPGTDL